MFVKRAPSAMLALFVLVAPAAVMAQAVNNQATAPQSPIATARDAAATWAGFAASQQLFGPPGANPSAPTGVTTPGGAVIAPADISGRMPPPVRPGSAEDGILRSAAPALGVDADGHGVVVSGASLR